MTFRQVVIACLVLLPLLMVFQKGTALHERSRAVRQVTKGLDVLLPIGLLIGLCILFTKIGA